MKKRSDPWFKNPSYILGIFALVGVIGTGVVKVAAYITLPTRVEAVEEKTGKIEDYIREQQIANDLMQQMLQKENPEMIISPDGKKYYDPKDGKWKPLKK